MIDLKDKMAMENEMNRALGRMGLTRWRVVWSPEREPPKTDPKGNTEGMARALTELRKAKIRLMELAVASGEELAMPLPYENYKKDKEDLLY